MVLEIERKISNLIPMQFPGFYREESPLFVQFVKAYYEWMESDGNTLGTSRQVMALRDLDETKNEFLEHFQTKYLYGIPFDVIINKRLLLKHVLDVYRSKGSIQGYKLLFRLVYNEDIDVYLPGIDVLRMSDGKWKEIRFVEVTYKDDLGTLIGKTILGTSSGVTAVVENVTINYVNQNRLITLYISNIAPKMGDFHIGEKLIDKDDSKSDNLATLIDAAPTVIGSLDRIEIVNGGRQFSIGDLIKIAHKDIIDGSTISQGVGGIVKVAEVFGGRGHILFDILASGSGYSLDNETKVMVYNNALDTTGSGASFVVSSYFDTELVTYNTDVLAPYLDMTLDSAAFGFPGNPSANASNMNMGDYMTFVTRRFGSIGSLGSIRTGSFYTQAVDVFVRTTIDSEVLNGSITYDSSSNTVTGTGTNFDYFLEANSVISLQANSSDSSSIEHHVVYAVNSNTSLTLYGKPTNNSTPLAVYRTSPNLFAANFSIDTVTELDGSVLGNNAIISGAPSFGNNVISQTKAIESGHGYVNGEYVKLYIYGGLTTPNVVSGGTGYSNGEQLVFRGGLAQKTALGKIITDSNGSVVETTLTYAGSGYQYEPTILVRTLNGTGAEFSTTVTEFNDLYEITGRVVKRGIGRQTGKFLTTDGFLNSDKYIHDSYYYQDFSYQINAPLSLNKYRDILYSTFHTAGSELFGSVVLNATEDQTTALSSDPINYANAAILDLSDFYTVDTDVLTADIEFVPIDMVSDTPGFVFGFTYNGSEFVAPIAAAVTELTVSFSS